VILVFLQPLLVVRLSRMKVVLGQERKPVSRQLLEWWCIDGMRQKVEPGYCCGACNSSPGAIIGKVGVASW
jgi:hypothetical protein